MIGLVIATHAGLASELLNAAESIVGPLSCAQFLSIEQGCDLDLLEQQLREAIMEVGAQGDGVLIMTDMFGGTPANLSARFLSDPAIEVINGVNLPMVLKFSSCRNTMPLKEVTTFLQSYGQKSIVVTRDILTGMEH
ncbi:MAG: PTS system fructose subfamily IIA component [Desulfuromonas sp.]|nr:PTS system fructose subfamily IIA component [Desulfuromonas sp.]